MRAKFLINQAFLGILAFPVCSYFITPIIEEKNSYFFDLVS